VGWVGERACLGRSGCACAGHGDVCRICVFVHEMMVNLSARVCLSVVEL
jgi:hypothetical protein